MSSIEPSNPTPSEISVPETILPAFDLEPGLFKREGWELVLSEDGWYLLEKNQAARRITVAEAVTTFGKNGRSAVFGPTRKYIAALGREMAEKAWIARRIRARFETKTSIQSSRQIRSPGLVTSLDV